MSWKHCASKLLHTSAKKSTSKMFTLAHGLENQYFFARTRSEELLVRVCLWGCRVWWAALFGEQANKKQQQRGINVFFSLLACMFRAPPKEKIFFYYKALIFLKLFFIRVFVLKRKTRERFFSRSVLRIQKQSVGKYYQIFLSRYISPLKNDKNFSTRFVFKWLLIWIHTDLDFLSSFCLRHYEKKTTSSIIWIFFDVGKVIKTVNIRKTNYEKSYKKWMEKWFRSL